MQSPHARPWPSKTLAAVAVLGALAFTLVAFGVFCWPAVAAFDIAAGRRLQGDTASWVHAVLRFVSASHQTGAVLLAAGLLEVWMLRCRERSWALFAVLAIPGGMLLNVVLKQGFQRARPPEASLAYMNPSFSFPSGHTMAAAVLYGTLMLYLIARIRHPGLRAAAVLACAGAVAAVAFSRLYLGVHFVSDVTAALLEAVTWLALCALAVRHAFRPRPGSNGSA